MNGVDAEKKRALIVYCRELFKSNIIGTDIDDVQAFKVIGRDFPQQLDGDGVHISFSVSWHMIGKTGEQAHDALDVLLPGKHNDE